MADLLKMLELKNQLAMLINELDGFSVDPSTENFEDKMIFANIYSYPANVGVFSEASGRNMFVKDHNALQLMGYYYNAIQETGAFVSDKRVVTRETDYIILSKHPEEIADDHVGFGVWEKVKSQYEGRITNYYDWEKTFLANKDNYTEEIYEHYVDCYKEILDAIKKASDGRTKKKKDPQPAVKVLWEDQMYKYLMDTGAFDREVVKCKLTLKQTAGRDFQIAYMRIEPFIQDGKSVEFSVNMKKGTEEEMNSAIEALTAFRKNLSDVAIVESEPKVVGKNVTMLVRSNKSDK